MRNTFSSGHFIKGFAVFMFVSLSCLFFPITVNAGSDSKLAEEYFVKAALLINFTKLIQWPTRELGTEIGDGKLGTLFLFMLLFLILCIGHPLNQPHNTGCVDTQVSGNLRCKQLWGRCYLRCVVDQPSIFPISRVMLDVATPR